LKERLRALEDFKTGGGLAQSQGTHASYDLGRGITVRSMRDIQGYIAVLEGKDIYFGGFVDVYSLLLPIQYMLARDIDVVDVLNFKELSLEDKVVRSTIRELRGITFAQSKLGNLLRVKVVIGVGVRFFVIL